MDGWFHHIALPQQLRDALKILIKILSRQRPQLELSRVHLAKLESFTLFVLRTVKLGLLTEVFIDEFACILGLVTAPCVKHPNFLG